MFSKLFSTVVSKAPVVSTHTIFVLISRSDKEAVDIVSMVCGDVCTRQLHRVEGECRVFGVVKKEVTVVSRAP